MEGCLAAAQTRHDARDCIGIAADGCTSTPDGYTTVGMSLCYGKELSYWDARLNAAYRGLMRRHETFDAALEWCRAGVTNQAGTTVQE